MSKKGRKSSTEKAADPPAADMAGPDVTEDKRPAEESSDSPRSSTKHLTEKGKLKENYYLKELTTLQEELNKLQYWVKENGLKVVILFEGRDAAGKGGVIKRILERTNPRIIQSR